jgi:glycosyltransferase involved in cell wall biosynthesis
MESVTAADATRVLDPDAPRGADRHRLLIVAHGYPPRQNSGAEVRARRKARWWSENGHDVCVVAADPQPRGATRHGEFVLSIDEVDGIPVHRIRFAVPDAASSLDESFRSPHLAWCVEDAVRAFGPDLLYQISGYLFGTVPARIAAHHGIPCALFATDYWHVCHRITLLRPDDSVCGGPRDPADCAACRLASRRWAQRLGPGVNGVVWDVAAAVYRHGRLPVALAPPDVAAFALREREVQSALSSLALITVESAFLADKLRSIGANPDRMLVLRQGIDRGEVGQRWPTRRERRDELRVLYLGQLQRHKGADLLVQACGSLAAHNLPVHLSIHGPAGNPAYVDRLRNAAGRIGVSVGPPLARSELADALATSDVLVVPSRWFDNSPNVILEAFAAGVPVVVAGHGGMTEMVRDGIDGLHFQPGSADSLARALRRLIDEPALLPRLRQGIQSPYDIDHEMLIEQAAIEKVLQSWRAAALPV